MKYYSYFEIMSCVILCIFSAEERDTIYSSISAIYSKISTFSAAPRVSINSRRKE